MEIDLLTFAHFGEAQSFINGLKLNKKETEKLKIYSRDNIFVLITGQGMNNAQFSLRNFINNNQNEINRLFNFGIAGKIESSLSLNHVYSIRAVCSKSGQKFNLHKEKGIDCFSSDKLISGQRSIEKLLALGQIVDMELWCIAAIAAELNIHLSAYKVISDDVSKEVDFRKIMENSQFYSEILFKYYIENYN